MGWQTERTTVASPLANTLAHLSRDELLLEWKETSKRLALEKGKELALRGAIVAREFKDVPEGTHYVELGNGYRLKTIIKQNYNLDKDNNNVEQALRLIEDTGTKGKFIAERLVKWEANLVLKEWRDLEDNIKKIISKVLTISPGTPQLDLIEPKANG